MYWAGGTVFTLVVFYCIWFNLFYERKKQALLDAHYHLPSLRVLLLCFKLGIFESFEETVVNGLDRRGLVVALHDPESQDSGTLHALRRVVDLLVVGADVFNGNVADVSSLLGSNLEITSISVSHFIFSFSALQFIFYYLKN